MALRPLEEIVPIDRPYIPPYGYLNETETYEGLRKKIKEGFDRATFQRAGLKYGYDILKRVFEEMNLPKNGLEARSLLENPYCGIPVFIKIGKKNPKFPEWLTRHFIVGWDTAIAVDNYPNGIRVRVITPSYRDLAWRVYDGVAELEKVNPRPSFPPIYKACSPVLLPSQ